MAEKSAREPRVYLWGTSRQVGTNLNAILRGRIFVQMLPRPPSEIYPKYRDTYSKKHPK